jgi:hypothetical protein
MTPDPEEMLEIIQTHYGQCAYMDGLYDPETREPYKYIMAVRASEVGGPDRTYYEASDDLDELYEQAGLVLVENVSEWQIAIATPLVIVNTKTGTIMEPAIRVLEFREMAGKIQNWETM